MARGVAFLFDLDGTLVDSLRDVTDAINDALRRLQRGNATPEQVRAWVGDGLTTLCRRAAPDADEESHNELIRLTRRYYQAHCTDNTRPYPNILQMLDLLKRRHMPMAVLSNKPHELAVQVVRALDLDRFFDDVRGCALEAERKPSPVEALRIAKRLCANPRQVFLAGDSVVDITTARHAGMIAVAATWGFQDRPVLEAAKPDRLVDDPLEIVEMVAEMAP